jgi:hypothetical protein
LPSGLELWAVTTVRLNSGALVLIKIHTGSGIEERASCLPHSAQRQISQAEHYRSSPEWRQVKLHIFRNQEAFCLLRILFIIWIINRDY